MDATTSDLLGKMPLAEATWLLWGKVLPDETLNGIFDSHRGRCYERSFTFADLVYLVNDALCQHGGRARQTLNRHESSEHLPASEQAFYGKLRRMPIAVSEAFLAESSNLLRPWLPKQPYAETAASLRDMRILVMDAKTFKHAAKRLKPVRGRAGRGLGGKALVAMELTTGLVVGMTADPDAHVNEAKLVPQLLPSIRERLPGVNLWMGDRQFGDLAQARRCTEQGDHFVLRLHPKSQFSPDSKRPTRRGVDQKGRSWTERIGELHSTRQGTMTVRRITLQRPGQPPLQIVTDLLDGERYPANDLLELYRQRWGIEQVFQKISEVFHLNHLIGSHPQAIIFQAALCMMLYNLLQAVRGIIAETQDRETSTVSTFNLLYDLNRDLVVLYHLTPPDRLLAALRERLNSITDLNAYLHERLHAAWTNRWAQSPKKKHHTQPVKHKRGTAGHFSIHRVLVQYETI